MPMLKDLALSLCLAICACAALAGLGWITYHHRPAAFVPNIEQLNALRAYARPEARVQKSVRCAH